MTPYDVLGVAKDATPAQIKRAYRKLARDTHPDRHPGDEDALARHRAVTDAYAVLSDPERRKRYDETGDASTAPPRDTEMLAGVLHPLLMGTMQQAADRGEKLSRVHVVSRMREQLATMVGAAKAYRGKIARTLAELEAAAARFTTHHEDGSNLLADMARAQSEAGRQALAGADADLAKLAAAAAYLEKCGYTLESGPGTAAASTSAALSGMWVTNTSGC